MAPSRPARGEAALSVPGRAGTDAAEEKGGGRLGETAKQSLVGRGFAGRVGLMGRLVCPEKPGRIGGIVFPADIAVRVAQVPAHWLWPDHVRVGGAHRSNLSAGSSGIVGIQEAAGTGPCRRGLSGSMHSTNRTFSLAYSTFVCL